MTAAFQPREHPIARSKKLKGMKAQIIDIQGEYTLRVINGKVVGFSLIADEETSKFIVAANEFRIESEDGVPFEVVDGITYIKNAVIQEAAISNDKLGARATFDMEHVFANYAGFRDTPAYGTYYPVSDGTTPIRATVSTGKGAEQGVNISFLSILKGDGGSADNFSVRCKRTGGTGGTIYLQEYIDIQALNDRAMPYSFEFIDNSAAENTDYTYEIEWKPIADGWPYFYNQFMRITVFKK